MNTIGLKPVRYYASTQLQDMSLNDLLIIIQENGWEDLIGAKCKIDDWKNIEIDIIRTIIDTKMNEWKQKSIRRA